MEIKLTTLNEDGSISFQGTLNQEQVQFILTVGVNYLLSQGAAEFLPDVDEDSFVIDTPDNVQ